MIRIVTDTASDISLALARQLNVELIPIGVSFGGVPYSQLEDDADFGLFYQMLESAKELPTTSQPPLGDFLELFGGAKRSGDEMVVILLSGGLSGTVQSARVARETVGYDKIYIVDSKNAIMGQRLLVEYAVRLREKGLGAHEIAQVIEEARARVKLFGALDTLKYLRKGGRIPKSTELLGAALGIKPIIKIAGGVVCIADKVRGRAGSVASMVRHIEENAGFDPAAPVYFGYTCQDGAARNFQRLATQKFKLKKSLLCPVGGIVGAHIGPGAFAITWLSTTDTYA